MPKILKLIKNAKEGSDTYHLIEKIAEIVQKENDLGNDDANWFEAQERINRYLLEEKLAEKMFEENDEIDYDTHLENAKEKIKYLKVENIESLAQKGVSLEKIIECNLRSHANQYYTIRQNEDKGIDDLENAVKDWKEAINCVANNLSKY